MRYIKKFPLLAFVMICSMTRSPVHAQEKDSILQQGNPPLTKMIVHKVASFIEWTLDLKFSQQQAAKLQNNIVGLWKTGNTEEIKGILSITEVQDQLERMTEEVRNNAKEALRNVLLENMKRDPDDEMSQLLTEAYKASQSGTTVTPSSDNTRNTKTTRNPLRVGKDGFTGIYRMVRPRAININNSGYESGFYIEYITFLPNGKLYWSLPPEGLLYFDEDVARRARPDDWGTYEIKGNEIHVLRGPAQKKYVITRNGDRLNNPPSLGKGSFRPIPNCDGLRLEGNYRRHESEPAINFTSDGKFREGGIFRNFGTRGRLDGSTYQDDGVGGSGTYIIEQNTLELQYTDGRVKRFVFIAFPENLVKKPAVESFLLYEDRLERF